MIIRPKVSKTGKISVKIAHGDDRKYYKTPFAIDPADWCGTHVDSSNHSAEIINEGIKKITTRINSMLLSNPDLTPTEILIILYGQKRTNKKKMSDLIAYFNKYQKQRKKSEGYILQCHQLLSRLPNIAIEQIDNDLVIKALGWNKISASSRETYCGILEGFKTYCKEKLNLDFKIDLRERKKESPIVKLFFLPKTRLKLAQYALETNNVTLIEFALQCYIGNRFSDRRKISKESIHSDGLQYYSGKRDKIAFCSFKHFDKDEMIQKLREKVIPFRNLVVDDFNTELRENLKKTGWFDKPVNYDLTDSSKIKLQHELITSHTARRTFVTCGLMQGIGEFNICKATTHSISSLQQYNVELSNRIANSI